MPVPETPLPLIYQVLSLPRPEYLCLCWDDAWAPKTDKKLNLSLSISPSFFISPALASSVELSKYLPNQTAAWQALSPGCYILDAFWSTSSFCISPHTSSCSSRLSESSIQAVSDKGIDCKQTFSVCVHVNACLCSRLEILKLFLFPCVFPAHFTFHF